MKKVLGMGAIGVGVGALVLLCSYYGMGLATEKMLKKNITALNQKNGMAVVIQDYKRGWFRSHAELKWSMKSPQSSAPPQGHNTVMIPSTIYTFVMPLDIYHGPVMFVDAKPHFGLGYAQSTARLPAAFAHELKETYDLTAGKLTYAIHILVSYLNNTTIQFFVSTYKLQAKKGNDYFQWLGLQTEIVVSSNKQRLQGDMALEGFSWFKKDIEGIAGPVKTEYDMHQVLNELYIGKVQVDVPTLTLFRKVQGQSPQPVFRIVGAQIHSESDIKNGLFATTISATAKELALGDRSYTNDALNISLKNLDANVLAAMNRKIRDVQRSGNNQKPAVWLLMPDVPALLSKGAQLTMSDFELTMLDGHVKADVQLSLPNEQMTNPFQLLQKINGESHLRVSETVVTKWLHAVIEKSMLQKATKQAQTSVEKEAQPATLNMADIETKTSAKVAEKKKEWIDSGVLVPDGQDYLILIKLDNGKLTINGHAFSPALLTI